MTDALLIRNATIATCAGPNSAPAVERLGLIPQGAVLVENGRIAFVGPEADAPTSTAEVVDGQGGLVMPGLVDPHTHLVFAGSRVQEFARRMAGEDYRQIAAEGGGIAATVRSSRAASDDELYQGAYARALALRAHGVTSIEVKSGYGLTTDDELRMLRIARRLDHDGVVRTTTTFLGAHSIPPEWRHDRDGYVDTIVDEMLPRVAAEGLADSCDVYCDDGAFSLAETRRILEAAQCLGLKVRAHVGQFADLAGPELLAELRGLSADHLEQVSDAGLAALARSGVVAVLLPGAWCTLRQMPPDVERLREAGVPIAIGTDCNPGTSPCTDLPLCAALAVRQGGLTLEEAVLGITCIAARAAGLDAGRLVVGAPADIAVFGHDDPRALAYALGGVRASRVYLGGVLVHEGSASDAVVW